MGKLEPLFNGFDIGGGVVNRGRRMSIQVDIWKKRQLAASGYHGSREPVRFMKHGVEGQHDPRDLVNPCLRGGAFKTTSEENIIERPMASLVYSIALGMVG